MGIVNVSCTTAETTLNDLTHQFKLLPSGRGYNLPKCRTNGLQYSLVPAAISLLNNVIFMYFLFNSLADTISCGYTASYNKLPQGDNKDILSLVPTLHTMQFNH